MLGFNRTPKVQKTQLVQVMMCSVKCGDDVFTGEMIGVDYDADGRQMVVVVVTFPNGAVCELRKPEHRIVRFYMETKEVAA